MAQIDRDGTNTAPYKDADKFDHEEQHVSQTNTKASLGKNGNGGLQPPDFIRNLSPEERILLEKKLKRKIENNIASARLAGLEEDLNLSSTQFQTAVSILFVGYILMQVPSNMVLDKIGKPSLYLPSCMIVWGVISAATGECQSYAGLLATRFFLGFVEAAYFPGCLFFLSSWYTRKELGFRTALLYSGSLLSGAFSGLIAAGILRMDGARGYRAWRWLFIIEGVVTVFIAFLAFFILPDFPKTTKWLTDEERILAQWRLEEDIGEEDWDGSEKQKLLAGCKLAFTDVKMWVLTVLVFSCVATGTVTNFFPTVVKTLGYNNTISLLLTAPPYVLAVITTFCNALHADKTGERYYHITIPLWLSLTASIIASATTNQGARYFAMMLFPSTIYAGYVVALAWISNTLPRPVPKRAAALAFINAVSNSASIYASYLYPKSAGPRYVVAMCVNAGTALLGVAAATVLRVMLVRLNKKLDKGEEISGTSERSSSVDASATEARHTKFLNRNKGFRFLV